MVGHGGSSAGSFLTDPTFPISSHCVSIVVTGTLRVKQQEIPEEEPDCCNVMYWPFALM